MKILVAEMLRFTNISNAVLSFRTWLALASNTGHASYPAKFQGLEILALSLVGAAGRQGYPKPAPFVRDV
jgi:hypothetical protein